MDTLDTGSGPNSPAIANEIRDRRSGVFLRPIHSDILHGNSPPPLDSIDEVATSRFFAHQVTLFYHKNRNKSIVSLDLYIVLCVEIRSKSYNRFVYINETAFYEPESNQKKQIFHACFIKKYESF